MPSGGWLATSQRAGKGLVEVLIGADPPPLSASPAERLGLGAATTVGGALVAWSAIEVVLPSLGATSPLGFSSYQGLIAGLGALLLAARYPLLGWRIAYVFVLVVPRLPNLPKVNSLGDTQLLLLLVVFALAGWRHSRAALWWMWALMLPPVWLWLGPGWFSVVHHPVAHSLGGPPHAKVPPATGGPGPRWWWPGIATATLTAVAVAVGATGAWQRARRALAAQAERTELEEARRAVLEERTRVARELHDVVAHHMSLIAVQTETARYRLPGLPEPALVEFASVSEQARKALTEMRRLLGVLRHNGPAERTPQPQLDDVPALVAASRAAGVAVELAMPQEARRVPPGVGLCAYRLVQEALANASRHAPGSSVSVRLELAGEALLVSVVNGPSAAAPALSAGPERAGHGLIGMRERVALLGGSFRAGPRPDGGFALSAVVPLDQSAMVALDGSLLGQPG